MLLTEPIIGKLMQIKGFVIYNANHQKDLINGQKCLEAKFAKVLAMLIRIRYKYNFWVKYVENYFFHGWNSRALFFFKNIFVQIKFSKSDC